MPKFPKNTSSAMKKSGPFKMKSPYYKKSALKNKPGSGVIDHRIGILDKPVSLKEKVIQKIIPTSIRHVKGKKRKKGILD